MILQFPLADRRVVALFRLPAQIWADTIHLVGDFNGWSTSATPMRLGEQYWEAEVSLIAGERYFFAYLLDAVDWRTEYLSAGCGEGGVRPPPCTLLPIEIAHARRSFPAG